MIRCWARRASDGAPCERRAGHHSKAKHHDGAVFWRDDDCAPAAGPDGRETAALRLLEVAHEIDRRAFIAGEHSVYAPSIRGIAARLFAPSRPADVDANLRIIEGVLHDREYNQMHAEHIETFDRDGLKELLLMAADILRGDRVMDQKTRMDCAETILRVMNLGIARERRSLTGLCAVLGTTFVAMCKAADIEPDAFLRLVADEERRNPLPIPTDRILS